VQFADYPRFFVKREFVGEMRGVQLAHRQAAVQETTVFKCGLSVKKTQKKLFALEKTGKSGHFIFMTEKLTQGTFL